MKDNPPKVVNLYYMNWYKQHKFSWNWNKFLQGLGLGTGIGLAGLLSYLHINQPQLQEIMQKHNFQEEPIKQELLQVAQNKGFDYPTFRTRLKGFEGRKNKVYSDPVGVKTIGVGHAMGKDPSDKHALESQKAFQETFGDKVNWNDTFNGKLSLDEKQIDSLTDYDINKHIVRTKRLVKDFDKFPGYLQHALVDAVYRGDLGPKTIKWINDGKWNLAVDEYVNHTNYNDPRLPGVKVRMDKNREAMVKYRDSLK